MKLSPKQERLLADTRFEERDTDEPQWIELFPHERRTARALAKRGLAEVASFEFEIRLTDAGRKRADEIMGNR